MRIYVPATLDELDAAVSTRSATRWSITPREVHGVTKALVAELPDEDVEGREYQAFLDAAGGSAALLAARGDAPPLRVVVTVEVPDDVLAAPPDDADAPASTLRLTVPAADVEIVCVHADEPAAAPDVRAVQRAARDGSTTEAAPGGEPAADDDGDAAVTENGALLDAVLRLAERDLLWYDWSEVSSIPR